MRVDLIAFIPDNEMVQRFAVISERNRMARSKKISSMGGDGLSAVAATIGRPELLVDGSDKQFRRLIQGIFVFAALHEAIRDSYAAHVGLGGVQYTILQIIRHFGTDEEMSIVDIAEQLRLSSSFITNETKKLEMLGFVEKRQSLGDRRRIVLSVSRKGADLLDNIAPLQRTVNDVQFANVSRKQFTELFDMIEQLTDSSQAALTLLHFLKRTDPNMAVPEVVKRPQKKSGRR